MARYRRKYRAARRKYRKFKRRVFRRRNRRTYRRKRRFPKGLTFRTNPSPKVSTFFTAVYRFNTTLELDGTVVAATTTAPFQDSERFAALADMFRFYRIRRAYLTIRPPAKMSVANTVPWGYEGTSGADIFQVFANQNLNNNIDGVEDWMWAYDPLNVFDDNKIKTKRQLEGAPYVKRRQFYSRDFTIGWTPNIMQGYAGNGETENIITTRFFPVYKPWLRTSSKLGTLNTPLQHNGISLYIPNSQRLTIVRVTFTTVIDFKHQIEESDIWDNVEE